MDKCQYMTLFFIKIFIFEIKYNIIIKEGHDNNMNIVDLIIILILVVGALVGFKHGVIRQTVSLIGFLLVVILAFLLKNPLSLWMYEHLPFFNFWGILKGVTVINILLYEVIAFLILIALFSIILKIILFAAKIIEKILTFTVILGIPSKILGAVVGIVEYFLLIFVALYIVTLPFFDIESIRDSKYATKILNNTPILSNYTEDATKILNDFVDLKEKYNESSNAEEFNKEALAILLNYKVVDVKSIDKLVERNKIKIDNIEEILKDYR